LDVTRGVQYLHCLPTPVVHGDLKPVNIFVDDEGCAKIGDFGLAKSFQETATGLTTSGRALGTIPWVAPELINASLPCHTTNSDVWAFGFVILEVRVHNLPYTQPSD
jgi:serine/threonine protein kinase